MARNDAELCRQASVPGVSEKAAQVWPGLGEKALAVPAGALRAMAENSLRHLLEADEHYKAGRLPSATASAILSIEQTGKFSWLFFMGEAPKLKPHAGNAVLFVALCNVIQEWPATSEWGKILRGEVGPDDLGLTAQQQKDVAEHPEVAEFIRRVQAGELQDKQERVKAWAEAANAKAQRTGSFKKWEPLIAHGLQHLRLGATYVDVTPDGAWTNPNTLDPTVPDGLCFGALGFLVLMLALASVGRPDVNVHDLLERMPEDITGLDVWKKAFPTLTATRRPL